MKQETEFDYNCEVYKKNIGKTLTKKEFFYLFPNYKPYKVITNEMISKDYKYSVNSNKIKKLKNNSESLKDGFYLTNITNICSYLSFGEMFQQ
jgi:hypothetical protein